MSVIGTLIETHDIKNSHLGVLTAASDSKKNQVVALMMDTPSEGDLQTLGQYGVTRVVRISSSAADLKTSPDLMAEAVIRTMKEFKISSLIALSSPTGKDLLNRVAARMDKPVIHDCIGVEPAQKTVLKSHFSGKTIARIKMGGDCFLCTVRPNAVEPVRHPCEIEMVSFDTGVEGPARVRIKEIRKSGSVQIDLTEASIIISGGRPMGSPENFSMLKECASKLGAAVGASRSAVDAGFAPHGMQVGQTGKTVSPKLYIACGISGAVQHYAGMKTSKMIVAINTDKDAPILGKCDYGIIGDLFEVVPEITAALNR
jgi:electron transfer flavoprotein alpha subunit